MPSRNPISALVHAALCALILLLMTAGARAQEVTPDARPDPLAAITAREAIVRAGPGVSYTQTFTLWAGIHVRIIERNSVGTWLRVQALGPDQTPVVDGWLFNGDLILSPDLRYSAVPVSSLPDADLDNITDPDLALLSAPPVIGAVSERMREVFEQGQALGNAANSVTKVGDSLSADPLYLNPMSRRDYVLGPYDYLEQTILFYGPSLEEDSVAARRGLTTYVVFDPMWSDPNRCQPGETPLQCEYRRKQPSVSMIMFGPNDLIAMDALEFDGQMRLLVEETLAAGIIPVLSTFSYSEDNIRWPEAVEFNRAIIDIAAEYELPLINLWSAARALPVYGLEGDYIHMRLSGYRNLQFDANLDARFGATLRNLLSIRMLDEIRRTLGLG